MIRVRVSDQPDLLIPRTLSTQLGLADNERVEVMRLGQTITLHRPHAASPRPLRSLAGLIKSSRPAASVDVTNYMTRRGYECLGEQPDSQVL